MPNKDREIDTLLMTILTLSEPFSARKTVRRGVRAEREEGREMGFLFPDLAMCTEPIYPFLKFSFPTLNFLNSYSDPW